MVLQRLPQALIEESGAGFVCITRGDSTESWTWYSTVGEFLSQPENMSGSWYIDGGWGGPPGPVRVDWDGEKWINKGFPPHD